MITVVSGLPRSGTSLVMQMLEAGGLPPLQDPLDAGAHRTADQSNPRGYYELDAVRRLRSGAPWIGQAEGRAVKVVAPLLALLPADREYRVVFVLRELDEILQSQSAMLGRLGRPAGDPAVLRSAFARQLDAALALAERSPHFSSLRVAHADLIGAPKQAAQRMARFLSTPQRGLDEQAMSTVVDPALYRSRLRP